MASEHDAERERIMGEVDTAIAPGKMTKQEAVEWLEELTSDIDGRIMALQEELSAEAGDPEGEQVGEVGSKVKR